MKNVHDRQHDHDRRAGVVARLTHALVPHAHDTADAIQTAEESDREGIRTAWISLVGMLVTAALQVVIVWLSGSIALLADTIHNLGHLATTIPLILAFKLGQRPPTRRYPYGFRRAEDLVGLLISAVIIGSIVLIVVESMNALLNPRELTNLGWVFAAGIVGFLGNEVVAEYRIRSGRHIGSAALIAEGQHARADGFTSLAVVAGVVGVWLGFPGADALAGLLIAVAIAGVLVNSLVIIVRRLMDGVEPDVLDRMTAAAAGVRGVSDVGDVRARWIGHRMEGDAVVHTDADQSLADAHALAHAVEEAIQRDVRNLDRVSVHVRPALSASVGSGFLGGHAC